MENRIVIFNQPIEMPGDNMEKIKTFGLLLPKVECETPETISRFIREYIFVIAVIFKHNATFLNGRNFLENGAKFVIYDKKWKQYAKMVEETNVQFAFFDGKVQIQLSCASRVLSLRGCSRKIFSIYVIIILIIHYSLIPFRGARLAPLRYAARRPSTPLATSALGSKHRAGSLLVNYG